MGELELERNQLIRNIETCRLRDIIAPFIGTWTVLDIMKHVAEVDSRAAAALQAFRTTGASAELLPACDQPPAPTAQDGSMIWPAIERLQRQREVLLAEAAAYSDEELTAEGSVPLLLLTACKEHDKVHWHDIAARLAGMAGARRNGAPNEQQSTSDS